MTYLIIFLSKILENAIATLRLIIVAQGKKFLGAILQGIISLIWILITGIIIVNPSKSPLKIIIFCLGCTVGSYLGSLIEEKTNNDYLNVTIKFKNCHKQLINSIIRKFSRQKIIETKYYNYTIVSFILRRKKMPSFLKAINNVDSKITVTTNKIKLLNRSLIN